MTTQTMVTPKQQFLSTYDKEHATTMKVLKAYPADKLDLRPHKMCKDARELAWMFVIEQGFMEKGATVGSTGPTPPAPFPKAPESWDALLSTFDAGQEESGGGGRCAERSAALRDDQVLHRAEDDQRCAEDRVPLDDPLRSDPPPRPVLDLSAHG